MRIAIIQKEDFSHKQLVEDVKENWIVSCFTNSNDLLNAKIELFDVILIDCHLTEISWRKLVDKLSKLTKAILGLMSDGSCNFVKEEIDDDSITVFIDKNNVEDIIDWLKYTDAKLRIKHYAEREQESFSATMMAISDNGYVLEQRSGVSVLGISRILSDNSKKKLYTEFEKTQNNVVVYFTEKVQAVFSAYLSELVFMYRNIKEAGGKICFWKNNREDVAEIIVGCRLNLIMKVFDKLEDAIDFVKR